MPHHPSEEVAPDNLTDKVAQHSKDSTASDHPIHDENKGPVQQSINASAQQFSQATQAKGGPTVPEGELPKAKGKEELQAEAKKLNS